jgi:Major capsid protein N-terminus
MAGGLLNFTSEGDANIFLNGNPDVSLYRKEYKKITNFGLQKFRLDYFGQRNLRLTEESTFTFIVKRYADLLMDTYIVINIPDIYSPVYPPTKDTNEKWSPYEFHWIEELGTQMIKEITITSGSYTLQKYPGQYLSALVQRDFTIEKKELYNRMTGNIPELYNPSNCFGNYNTYPNATYTPNPVGAEPSIRGKQLFIPINTWFTLDSALAFPLICLQHNELTINVTFRPIMELFVVRDIFDYTNNYPYICPDQNREDLFKHHQRWILVLKQIHIKIQ